MGQVQIWLGGRKEGRLLRNMCTEPFSCNQKARASQKGLNTDAS
jgi:hypothetical protein